MKKNDYSNQPKHRTEDFYEQNILNQKKDSSKNNEIEICPSQIYDKLSDQSKFLIEKANTDNAAQYSVAKNFINGVGRYPKDLQIGIAYLQKAIENGNEEAAIYYNDKIIVNNEDIANANEFIKEHSKSNNPLFDLLKGLLLMRRNQYEKAKKCFIKGVNKGNSRSAFQLGVLYRDGLGVDKNLKISSDYFIKAKELKNNPQSKVNNNEFRHNLESDDLIPKESDMDEDPKTLYDKGIKCLDLKKDKIKDAIYYFKLAVKKGNAKSMTKLSDIYFNGYESIKVDYHKALKYLKLAADNDDLESTKKIAAIYEDGEIIEQNSQEACKYYKMAADKGDSSSMNKYALMLDQGEGVKLNKKLACKYYKMAADKGNHFAMFNYALMLINGEGTKIDLDTATDYLQKSASLGDENAKNELKKVEIKKLKLDADNDDDNAMFNYAMILIKGEDVKKNVKEGIQYLKMASNKGNRDAKIELRRIEVSRIKHKIENGDTKAMIKLSKMYANGKKVKKNLKLAKKYLLQAIDLNDEEAEIELKKLNELQIIESDKPYQMLNYGKKLEFNGDGSKNIEEAKIWYKRAADHGFLPGILNYTRILSSQIVEYKNAKKEKKKTKITKEVLKSYQIEVEKYYQIAVEKGSQIAMLFYGLYLEHGDGLKTDKEKAVELYRKSAKLGNLTAMSNLGRCLEHGIGTEKNPHDALKWYKTAIKKGSKRAIGEYDYLLKELKKEEEGNQYDDDDDFEINSQNDEEEEIKEEVENDDNSDEQDEINDDESNDDDDSSDEDYDENDPNDGIEN